MQIIDRIIHRVIIGNIDEVGRLTKEAIVKKIAAQKIIEGGFIPGLDVV